MAKILTSLVTLLDVAGPRLHGGALAPVVEAIAGATALLDPVATCRRAGGPLGPRGPAIVRGVAGCGGNRFVCVWSLRLFFRLLCSGLPSLSRGWETFYFLG